MRKELSGLMAATLVALIGCNQTSTPGGPGVSTTPGTSNSSQTVNRPTFGEAAGTFELSLPLMAIHLKQGETKPATISLSRGKDFDEDVTLKLVDVPAGVMIEPSSPQIMHSEKEVKLNLTAAHDAIAGSYTINVIGHPTKGADATSTMKITIAKE